MNDKIIYIKPDEEITSVIDRLTRIKSSAAYLVIPKAAVLTQSLVNLKLLKREAKNLRKVVTIVSEDDAAKRMAQKAEFAVSDFLPEPEAPQEILQQPEEPVLSIKKPPKKNAVKNAKSENDDVLDDEISPADFEDLLREEKKSGSPQMSDILKFRSGSVHGPAEASIAKKIVPNKPLAPAAPIKMTDGSDKDGSEILDIERELPSSNSFPASKSGGAYERWQEIAAPKVNDDFMAPRFAPNRHIFSDVASQKSDSARPANDAPGSFSMKIFGLFVASAIVIAGLVFYLVLPKAEITISAKHEILPFSIDVTADKNLTQPDYDAAKIPAQVVRLEEQKTMEFETTGERQLNEKARGVITVYNAYSSSQQTLVETTRFVSSEGRIYRLTRTTDIPGAKIEEGNIVPSSINVEVEADQPGEDFNVGPTEFTIPGFKGSPKYVGFYAKSAKAISGGSTGLFRVLTQEDFDKAKAQITEVLKQQTQADLAGHIPENYKLAEGAIQPQITELKSSVEVGGKAEKFTLDARAQATALIFSEADIRELIRVSLADDLADQKDAVDDPVINYGSFKIDFAKGQMTFLADGSQDTIWRVDKDEIKKSLAGKSQDEISSVLSDRPEIDKADFSLSPFWTKSIPSQTDKIEIEVN